VRPGGRLDVGQQLAQVVAIVMNPLVQEVAHSQVADLRMEASTREIADLELGNEGDAISAERLELGDERRPRTLAVASGPGDFALIPAFEARLAAREDQADAAGEAAPLSMRWPSTSLAHHSPGAGCHARTSSGKAASSA
jgi:hypothetical protein